VIVAQTPLMKLIYYREFMVYNRECLIYNRYGLLIIDFNSLIDFLIYTRCDHNFYCKAIYAIKVTEAKYKAVFFSYNQHLWLELG